MVDHFLDVIKVIENIIVPPWRSGKCLKKEDQSFDEAFNSFNFTIQQTQYMKIFNLQYEFNDARDDFSAQLKKDNSSGGVFN